MTTKLLKGLCGTFVFTAVLAVTAVPALATVPTVVTDPVTNVTATSATLHATVETYGEAALVGWEYSLVKYSEENATNLTIPRGETEPVHVEATVTGLKPSSTYYVRAGVIGGGGANEGQFVEFHTPKLLGLYLDTSNGLFKDLTYPATNSGAGTEPFRFTASGYEMECLSPQYSGTKSGDTNYLDLTMTSAKCESSLGETTVSMNSCTLRPLTTTWSGSTMSLGIRCGKEGDSIAIVSPGCTVSIPAQEFAVFGSVQAKGENKEGSTIELGGSRSVSFTKSGPFCFVISGKTGSLKFATKLGQTG